MSVEGPGLPRYVEQEFRRYVSCGILSEGFCRVECQSCGDEMLVAFSCRGRGFCPSCCGRRMNDTAAHLVDRVLPWAPYRQWVLSYPRKLRLLLARNASLARDSVTLFLREVFRWQRRRAKKLGKAGAKTGAVCFTQRFGTRVDLNVHHHAVLPDGVFAVAEEGGVGFVELPRPDEEELTQILTHIVKKTLVMVSKRVGDGEEQFDALSAVQREAVQPMFAGISAPSRHKAISAFIEGFSLEAGTHVHQPERPAWARAPMPVRPSAAAGAGAAVHRDRRPGGGGAQEGDVRRHDRGGLCAGCVLWALCSRCAAAAVSCDEVLWSFRAGLEGARSRRTGRRVSGEHRDAQT